MEVPGWARLARKDTDSWLLQLGAEMISRHIMDITKREIQIYPLGEYSNELLTCAHSKYCSYPV